MKLIFLPADYLATAAMLFFIIGPLVVHRVYLNVLGCLEELALLVGHDWRLYQS